MSIEVQQLLKIYGAQKAVDHLSFSAPKGKITGFLGPNGAGKTTTMKMITGFLQPDAGEVWVDGISVKSHPLEARKKIGYLPESNALYYDMYVREYLSFVASVYQLTAAKQAVQQVIDKVGLGPEASKKIGQLSKGYKQRVGLAAAIIHQPEVIILDEPTSGLDPNQIVEIRQVIQELGQHKTVLLSTHIMQEVEAICDQVIIINKGAVVANDSMENLTKQQARPFIKVSLAEPLEAAWLSRLPSVEYVEKLDSYQWQLHTQDAGSCRRELMQMAIENNLNITGLSEGGSLEELFRQLTTGDMGEQKPYRSQDNS
jgi:ABC-2 type transport system ATP-binding protein